MTASTTSQRVKEVKGTTPFYFEVKDAETIYQGCLVALDSNGELVDATETASEGPYFIATGNMAPDNPASATQRFGLTAAGTLTSALDGTRIEVKSGLFWFKNGESIVDSDVGSVAYCDDNQTVKTTSTSTSPVGVILAVDSTDGVLVNLYPHDSAVPDGSITTAKLAADAVTGAKIADDQIDSEHYVAASIDNEHLADDAVDSAELADGAVDPVHMATTRYRAVSSDGALTIVNTDEMIHLVGSASGAKAATLTSATQGQRLKINLAARSGGSYTVAADYPAGTSGTVTLDAAGESVELAYDGSAWVVMDLNGATFA